MRQILLSRKIIWVAFVVSLITLVVILILEPDSLAEIILSLLTNVVASFFLYFLVVVLPELRTRQRIKANCFKSYRYRKRVLLHALVSASIKGGRDDLELSGESIDRLMSPEGFRKSFEHGHEADEGIYAFSNYIQNNENEFREIIFELRLIARQLEYVLNNCDISDDKLFDTVSALKKRFMRWTHCMRLTTTRSV